MECDRIPFFKDDCLSGLVCSGTFWGTCQGTLAPTPAPTPYPGCANTGCVVDGCPAARSVEVSRSTFPFTSISQPCGVDVSLSGGVRLKYDLTCCAPDVAKAFLELEDSSHNTASWWVWGKLSQISSLFGSGEGAGAATYWAESGQLFLTGYNVFMYGSSKESTDTDAAGNPLNAQCVLPAADGTCGGMCGSGCKTLNKPGERVTQYLSWAMVRDQLMTVPAGIADGSVRRGNELGLAILNDAFFADTPEREIGLGASKALHDVVRPVLDRVYGPLSATNGNWGGADPLRASAQRFIRGRQGTLDLGKDSTDQSAWTQMVLHETALDWAMTVAEAKEFVAFQTQVLLLVLAPQWATETVGIKGILSVEEVQAKKAQWKARYVEKLKAVTAQGAGGSKLARLLLQDADGNAVQWDEQQYATVATAMIDAHIFAGGASMPDIIRSSLAVLFKGHQQGTEGGSRADNTRVDWGAGLADGARPPGLDLSPGSDDVKLLVWEVARAYPPVFGFPFYDVASGHRHLPNVGWAMHDPDAVGAGANDFVFRRPARLGVQVPAAPTATASGAAATAYATGHFSAVSEMWKTDSSSAADVPAGGSQTDTANGLWSEEAEAVGAGNDIWNRRLSDDIWTSSPGTDPLWGDSGHIGGSGGNSASSTLQDAAASLQVYEALSLGWADAATPNYPHHDELRPSVDARYCPAKRMSMAMAVAFVEAMQLEGGVQRWAVDGGTAAITRPAVSTGTAWDGFVLRDAQQQVQDAGYEWTYANPSLPGVPFHAAKPAAEDAALMWLVDVGVQGQVPTLLNALYARLGLSASANMRTQVADLAESARRLGFEASGLTASGALNGQTRMLAQNANANAGAGAGAKPMYMRKRAPRRLAGGASAASVATQSLGSLCRLFNSRNYCVLVVDALAVFKEALVLIGAVFADLVSQTSSRVLEARQTHTAAAAAAVAAEATGTPAAAAAAADAAHRHLQSAISAADLLAQLANGDCARAAGGWSLLGALFPSAGDWSLLTPDEESSSQRASGDINAVLAACLAGVQGTYINHGVGDVTGTSGAPSPALTLQQHHELYPVLTVPPAIRGAITGTADAAAPVPDLPTGWFASDDMFEWQRVVGSDAEHLRRATAADIRDPAFGLFAAGGALTDNVSGMSVAETLAAMGPLLPPSHASGLDDSAGPLSLDAYAQAGRLAWLDYSMFSGVAPADPAANGNPDQKYLYPARALFAVTAGGDLKALAIQCTDAATRATWDAALGAATGAPRAYTPPRPDVRARLRSAGFASLAAAERVSVTEWAMAKTCVQVAEQSHFELITHLGRTHLVLEAVAIATHRKLPKGHALRQLLGAHLEGTMHINDLATGSLIGPAGAIDQAFAPAIADAATVAAAAANAYLADFHAQRFDAKVPAEAGGGLPDDLEYPLRDDGGRVWSAVQQWAAAYVGTEYTDDASVAADAHVQAWAAELTSAQGGRAANLCGRANAGAGGDRVTTKLCLAAVVAQVIWVATAGHASTNYPQAQFTAYTPLAPVAGYSRGPDYAAAADKASGRAWLDMLPRAQGAVLQRDAGANLGSVYYNWAGHYLGQYAGTWDGWLDARHDAGQQQFRDALAAAGSAMGAANAACAAGDAGCTPTRRNSLFPYTVLLPHNIPQSINI